jgi:hypothetical protein
MKKLVLIVWLILLVAILAPVSVKADSPLAVTESPVVIQFPGSITFNVTVTSNTDVEQISLHYIVNRHDFAKIVSEIPLTIKPSTKVAAQWVMDMRKTGGMPPGSSLDYWWTATDDSGNQLETAPARVDINDNRYNWHSQTWENVTLYWYQGSDVFAGELMTAIQEALSRLSTNTGAELQEPVKLYIYNNAADLRGSMIYPQEWTGGVAYTEYGIIAIGIGADADSLAWGKKAIAHELTHLVVHQVTMNPYNSLPTWLDEGLAMNAEGALDLEFITAFYNAKNEDALISVRSLASPFSADTTQSLLGYAESYKIVTFLIDTYGRDKMLELLDTFRQGSGYDEALEKVYGFDMDGLDARWLATFKTTAVR